MPARLFRNASSGSPITRSRVVLDRARILILTLGVACATSACAQTQSERDADFAARVPHPAPMEIAEPPPAPRPPLNPKPRQGIKVSGRLPAHMQAGLRVMYATTSRKAECVDIVSMFGKVVGGDAKRFEEPMEVRHIGDRFEADLFLDKYGPGDCGWRLLDADLWVRKPTPDGPALVYIGAVVDVSRYDTPNNEPMCRVPKRADGTGCDEARLRSRVNGDDSVRVSRLCKWQPMAEYGWTLPHIECDGLLDDSKTRHLIKPGSKAATIDIYDMDREPGPPTPNSKESK